MNTATSGGLTERHLTLFGAIVHSYARYELLMQRIMARAIGADGSAVILLTRTMTFTQKRDALLALLRHRRVPLDQVDAIRDCLKLPSRMRTLCDDIRHSDWTAGASKDSIQPAWIFQPSDDDQGLAQDAGHKLHGFQGGRRRQDRIHPRRTRRDRRESRRKLRGLSRFRERDAFDRRWRRRRGLAPLPPAWTMRAVRIVGASSDRKVCRHF